MSSFNFNPNHAVEENMLQLEEKFFELDKLLQNGLRIQRNLTQAVAKVTAAPDLSFDERIQSLADLAVQALDINARVRRLKRRVEYLDVTIQALREFTEV